MDLTSPFLLQNPKTPVTNRRSITAGTTTATAGNSEGETDKVQKYGFINASVLNKNTEYRYNQSYVVLVGVLVGGVQIRCYINPRKNREICSG